MIAFSPPPPSLIPGLKHSKCSTRVCSGNKWFQVLGGQGGPSGVSGSSVHAL